MPVLGVHMRLSVNRGRSDFSLHPFECCTILSVEISADISWSFSMINVD